MSFYLETMEDAYEAFDHDDDGNTTIHEINSEDYANLELDPDIVAKIKALETEEARRL